MILEQQYPRRYLPNDFDPASVEAARRCFDELAARPLNGLASLETWLRDFDELSTAIAEERSRRFIRLTCNTTDSETEKAYRSFVESMVPLMKQRSFDLEHKLLECPSHRQLDPRRFKEYLDAVAVGQRLFRPENLPLQVEEIGLDNEYDKTSGSTTVEFDGLARTLPQMKVFSYDPDRGRREAAWRAAAERVRRDAGTYEGLFDRLFDVRTKIARNAGCRDYVEYRFAQLRRPYTPGDCRRFHESVRRVVLPVLRNLQARRREQLGVDTLRPWDLAVDVQGRPPMRLFSEDQELVALAKRLLERVDPEFGQRIDWMARSDLLDLTSRAGKAPGGYMCTLDERRVPFIFMNAVGVQSDVKTFLHEGGHAFHAFEMRPLEPSFNRHAPTEFAEVASMAMELLCLDCLDGIYSEEDARRARLDHYESIARLLCWIATIDRFQLDLYEGGPHTREQRRELWLRCYRTYRGDVDYIGLEDAEADRWHLQPHLFGQALYYIEYAIAQLGALQVWRNFRRDRREGVRAYRRALALGSTRALPELFEAAGARFDFGEDTVGELMQLVSEEIESLS